MVKTIFIYLFAIGFTSTVFAQNIISVSPTQLIASDTMTAEIRTTFGFLVGPPPAFCGSFVESKDSINGNEINLDLTIDISGVKSANSCTRFDTVKVQLPSIPGTYQFNCYLSVVDSLDTLLSGTRVSMDSINITVNTLSSIEEGENSSTINTFPSPAIDMVYIQDPSNQIERIEVYSIKGEKLLETANFKSIDVSSFASGLYFLNLELKSGEIATKKIIIE
jgi:hypothetical protein